MKKFLLVFLILSVFLSGIIAPYAESIEIYTFKKKRVDQELKGNQGYIMGTPPAPGPRKDKRTIIGIDVELPSMGDDEYEEEELMETSVETISDKNPKQKPVTVVSDEDWIK